MRERERQIEEDKNTEKIQNRIGNEKLKKKDKKNQKLKKGMYERTDPKKWNWRNKGMKREYRKN